MQIQLPALPYAMDALEPHLSTETMSYHYERHHRGYVDKLNKLIEGTDYSDLPLESIIDRARQSFDVDILDNALQVWNHTFLWQSMSPNGGGTANGRIATMIDNQFGDFDAFRKMFRDAALGVFGSGWVWLVESFGELKILTTSNADSPVNTGVTPLLVIDVWEHAYYIDYRNARAKYVDTFLENMINWDFASANLQSERRTKAA